MGADKKRKSISHWIKYICDKPRSPSKPNSSAYHLQQGFDYEQRAKRYLIQQGLKLRQHNFQCKYGEIDLIMLHNDMLVFVEVRFRQSAFFGQAYETIHNGKQRRLLKTAQFFLQHNPHQGPCRFDIISYTGNGHECWIQNAFENSHI